jgi:hypothetical protein
MMDYPACVFAVCLMVLWLAEQIGSSLSRRRGELDEEDRADLDVILNAALALLGLLIGFTFSMAISRYNQRKDLEAAEANAIGTEYARAGLLPATEAARVRELLKRYTEQRLLFYRTRDARQLQRVNGSTAQLQTDLWSVVQNHAAAQPTPVVALTVAGMNDVLNSQAYTQSAWWNRIPIAAWALMMSIAICCHYLIGFTAHRSGAKAKRLLVLPLIVSTAFLLVADVDSPRGGVIRVHPLSLENFSASLRAP